MQKIKNVLSEKKWKKRRICCGTKNRDKTFYVIRRNSKTVGLFSYVLSAMGHIRVALELGYVPIVDMQNYISPYSNRNKKENVWEYYFEQPAGYSLQDIKWSRNIILSSGNVIEPMPGFRMFSDENELSKWRQFFHEYIHLNAETESYITNIQKQLFGDVKILGVLCRGTDYRDLKPKYHPVQPDIQDVIEKTREALKAQQCKKIYLATEDANILEVFRKEFGELLLFPEFELRPYEKQQLISTIEIEREDDNRLKGLEYLTQIALLSRCHCFIGSGCGGSYAALLMSEGYEWQYLWNLGTYS